jgi:hypothetical protein
LCFLLVRHNQAKSSTESNEKSSFSKEKHLSKTAPITIRRNEPGEGESLILSSKEEEILNTIRFRRKQEQEFSPCPPVKPRPSSSSSKNQQQSHLKQVKQPKRQPSFNDEDDFSRPSSGNILYNHSINNLG